MFGAKFQRKYALTGQGVENVKKGTFWTVIVNLVVMGGVSILYLVMSGLMTALTGGASLPSALPVLAGLGIFVLLSFLTHLQQYKATYGLVYREVKATRLRLAERLRKLPLGYFGKRDLADLTETLMGDVNRMEHVWSHVLGYLYGSYISTAVIAVCLLWYDWRLAIACLWGVPVAFVLLFGSRKSTERQAEQTKEAAVRVSDGMQEALENVREIRAANQEDRYLSGLYRKIDDHERVMIRGELVTGLFVNGASVIMRLGVATTILVGAQLILAGQIDFMLLFLFLMVITRIYAPFDQSLALIAELFVSQVSADRMNGLFDTPLQKGRRPSVPKGTTLYLTTWTSPMTKRRFCRMSALPPGKGKSPPWWVPPARAKALVPAGSPAVGCHRRLDPGGWGGYRHGGPGDAAKRLFHGLSGGCSL